MECTTVRESMLEALYGEAGAETARRVEEHLEVCAACREEMAAFRRLRAQLRAYSVPRMAAPGLPRRPGRALVGLAAAAALAIGAGAAVVQARVAALERALEAQQSAHVRELSELHAALAAAQNASTSARPADAAVLERVGEMIRESEARQSQRFDASMRELSERAESQRRYDLARVSAGLSYLDGRSGQRAARTAELMGYVLQAAEKK